ADRADFVLEGVVGASDGGAHALGVGYYGFTLISESIDQRTDSRLVLAVGSLDLVDFAVDKRFQLDGARKRTLDAFAHGGHFAAHGLADHHHAVRRQVFRLG